MNNNISENLFQAIDILTSQKISNLKYDKTLLCKITDDSKKARGEYLVSDGSSVFTAYSDVTTYGDGISVYVTVPEGNFENKKIITGKYVEENGQFYTFKEPLEDFLDITDNIIEEDVARSELIANGPIKEKTLWRWLRDEDGIKTGDSITATNYTTLINLLPDMAVYFKRKDNGEYEFTKTETLADGTQQSCYLLYTAEAQAQIKHDNELLLLDQNIAEAKKFSNLYKTYLEGATWHDWETSGTIYGESNRVIDWKKDLVDGAASYYEFVNAVDYFTYNALEITEYIGYNQNTLANYSTQLNNNWGSTAGENLRKQIASGFFTRIVAEIDNYNATKNKTREEYIKDIDKELLDTLSFIDELADKNLLPKEYTRLAISGEFSTWLSSFKTAYGTYGLRLDITSREVSDVNSGETTKKYYSYYLDSSEFYGNIYDFASFYYQSKMFDISMVTEIEAMRLVFYQNGDFTTIDKEPIPAAGSIRLQNLYIALGFSANEFDEDKVFLYTLDGETYDAVSQKVGPDALNHNRKTLKARWAHKLEDGQTVLIDKEGELEEMSCEPKLHWYKMKLEQGICDELAGNFWIELTENLNRMSLIVDPDITTQNERYRLIVEYPSLEWINAQRLAGLQQIDLGDNELEDALIEKYLSGVSLEDLEKDYTEEAFETVKMFYQDADNVDAQYNDGMVKYYYSETLLLENESQIPNQATLDLVQGLKIITDAAGLKGNYCIYEMTNEIMTASEASRLRTLEATYESLITREPSLDKASVIFWKFPVHNTMIQMPVAGKEYVTEKYIETHPDDFKDGYDTINCVLPEYNGVTYIEIDDKGNHTLVEHNGYYILCRQGTENYNLTEEEIEENKGSQQINVLQNFRIRDYYMQSSTNNDIICEVVKNGLTYKAKSEMMFGPKGTNGTDCTLIINFQDDKQAIWGEDDSIIAEVHLYDHENKEVEITNVTWGFFATDGKLGFKNQTQIDKTIKATKVTETGELEEYDKPIKVNIVEIARNSTEYKAPFEHNILQASVRYGVVTVGEQAADAFDEEGNLIEPTQETRDVTLTAYMPIPFCYNPDAVNNKVTIRTADIPTRIVYDNNGTNPSYYSQPFNFTALGGGSMEIDSCYITYPGWDDKKAADKVYYPSVKHYDSTNSSVHKNGWTLLPLTMYMGNLDPEVTLLCILKDGTRWYQPLLVIQNRWASAMLNAWDGSLTIDEKNGTILSTMVGAGRKESDNTFTGVLMGDVESVNSDKQKLKQTGVYGFNHGQQSFGLKDDGTAFFGKSGKGQIQFDGNRGIIQSMSYAQNVGSGMMIDLDDGVIDMRGAVYDVHAIAQQFFDNKVAERMEEVPASFSQLENVEDLEAYLKELSCRIEEIHAEADEVIAELEANEVWEDTPEYERLYEEAEQVVKERKYIENRKELEQYIHTNYTVAKYSPTGSRVHIDTLDPYLFIETGSAEDPFEENKSRRIMHVGANKYYLQTADYRVEKAAVKDEWGYITTPKVPGRGLRFDLMNGALLGYNFQLRGVNSTGDSLDGSFFELNSSGNPFLQVHYVNSESENETTATEGIDLIKIDNNNFIMHSQNWQEEKAAQLDDYGFPITEHKVGKGLRINMNKGDILGYDFSLKGYHSAEDNNNGSFFEMDSDGKPYLRVFYKDSSAKTANAQNGLDLLYVGKDKYLLQSKNWQKEEQNDSGWITTYGSGLQFDLDKGRLTGYDFELKVVNSEEGDAHNGSYVILCSDGEPYLKVHYEYSSESGSMSNDLLNITEEDFYLRSHTYNSTYKSGTELDVAKGEFTTYDLSGMGGGVFIKSSGDPYFRIVDGNTGELVNLFYCAGTEYEDGAWSAGKYYLQSVNKKVKFNLTKATLKIEGAGGGYVLMTGGDSDPFFKIYDGSSTIFNAESNDYYLQSSGYPSGGGVKLNISEGILEGGTGTKTWSIQKDGTANFNYIEATAGGKLGPFEINSSAFFIGSGIFQSDTVYIGTSGISIQGTNFSVDSSGNATMKGNCTINGSNTLIDGTVEIKSDATVSGNLKVSGSIKSGTESSTNGWKINGDGDGHFGGWTFDDDKFYNSSGSDSIYLKSDGTFYMKNSGSSVRNQGSNGAWIASTGGVGITGNAATGTAASGQVQIIGNSIWMKAEDGANDIQFYTQTWGWVSIGEIITWYKSAQGKSGQITYDQPGADLGNYGYANFTDGLYTGSGTA